MRKTFSRRLLAAVLTLISLPSAQVSAKEVTLTGKTASEIVSEMTIGWNLGNTLDSHGCSGWLDISDPESYAKGWVGYAPTKALIQKVKSLGFDTIRIPVTWYEHVDTSNNYKIDSAWLSYVKKVVDWAYEEDMFIILNLHHEEGYINVSTFSDANKAKAKAYLASLWSQLADTFAGYDQHLIFEGMNEPRKEGAGDEWGDGTSAEWSYINELNATFVSTVRANTNGYNGERLLMLPGYHAGDAYATVNAIEIPAGAGNVALSVHAYEPYNFTMGSGDHTAYSSAYKESVESIMANLGTVSRNKNVPIIIGEFSASDFNNTEARTEWAAHYISQANKYGFPCVLWDNNNTYAGSGANGENHGYINRATYEVYESSKQVLETLITTAGSEYVEEKADIWDSVTVGDDWMQLFYSGTGAEIAEWGFQKVNFSTDYINDSYKLAVVYSGANAPFTLLETKTWKWLAQVQPTDTDTYVAYYSCSELLSTLVSGTDAYTVDDVYSLIVQAREGGCTLYGVYAVPIASSVQGVYGDMNGDRQVDESDIDALLMHYLLDIPLAAGADPDLTADNIVDERDIDTLLMHYLLG